MDSKSIVVSNQSEYEEIPSNFSGIITLKGTFSKIDRVFKHAHVYIEDSYISTIKNTIVVSILDSTVLCIHNSYVELINAKTIHKIENSSKISVIAGNTVVKDLTDSSVASVEHSVCIGTVSCSTIAFLKDNASIKKVVKAVIENMYGRAFINYAAKSSIANMTDNTYILTVYKSKIITMYNNTFINLATESSFLFLKNSAKIKKTVKSTIHKLDDNACIHALTDKSTLKVATGKSIVESCYGYSEITCLEDEAVVDYLALDSKVIEIKDNAVIENGQIAVIEKPVQLEKWFWE